jgi:integrase
LGRGRGNCAEPSLLLPTLEPSSRQAPRADRVDVVRLGNGDAPRGPINGGPRQLAGDAGRFGQRRGWCSRTPCKLVDKSRVEKNTDIRFLTEDELEALLRATTDPRARTLYMCAAMTGLRQGELLALRWQDVDWPAARIRVRRNYVRGEWGTPKTKRGSRSVPLADRLAGELERHFQTSAYQADDDLVFCHPQRGTVMDHSELVKRFKKALKAASVREVRFHDLRHTFGTRMAAAGVPLRTLQEWMGHRDFATTLIYADYQPSAREAEFIQRAFGVATGVEQAAQPLDGASA